MRFKFYQGSVCRAEAEASCLEEAVQMMIVERYTKNGDTWLVSIPKQIYMENIEIDTDTDKGYKKRSGK